MFPPIKQYKAELNQPQTIFSKFLSSISRQVFEGGSRRPVLPQEKAQARPRQEGVERPPTRQAIKQKIGGDKDGIVDGGIRQFGGSPPCVGKARPTSSLAEGARFRDGSARVMGISAAGTPFVSQVSRNQAATR